MAQSSYWDERATQRTGYARSVWHSQSFSAVWDERQRELLRRSLTTALGTLQGAAIADVGCGTGRISRFLAGEKANVTGFDFSPATVTAAEEETRAQGLNVRFVVADVSQGTLPAEPGSFAAAITVGCLAVACASLQELRPALAAITRLVPVGGVVQLLEPIHTTRALGRLLRAPLSSWVATAERVGLQLEGTQGMGFVPVRLACANFDFPPWVVEPVFAAGERALHAVSFLERAADYRLLRFRRGE